MQFNALTRASAKGILNVGAGKRGRANRVPIRLLHRGVDMLDIVVVVQGLKELDDLFVRRFV
jgi:hypothetical protein